MPRGRTSRRRGSRGRSGSTRSGHYLLQLPLDDSKLPVPYVIDPGITTDVFLGTVGNTAASLNLALNVPTGTKADDLLLAHITWKIALAGTTIAVTKPGAWTQAIAPAATGTAITDIGGGVYWKIASGTDGNGSTSVHVGAQHRRDRLGRHRRVHRRRGDGPDRQLGEPRDSQAVGAPTTVLPMPALLPTVNNTEVVSLIGWNVNDTGTLLTPPAGEARPVGDEQLRRDHLVQLGPAPDDRHERDRRTRPSRAARSRR